MFKENGRAAKAPKRETSNKKGKKFTCPKCEASRTLQTVEFGEAVYCLCCDSLMNESV